MSVREPRRRSPHRGLILLALGLLAAALGWFFWPRQLVPASFTISRETTYFTAPVDGEGYVDYVAALDAYAGRGVTPQNNAVVLLAQAFGPKPEGERLPEQYYRLLGVGEPPDVGTYWISYPDLATKKGWVEEEAALNRRDEHVLQRAWMGKQFPTYTEWLATNAEPLRLVEEASRRGRFYSPRVLNPQAKPQERGLLGAWVPLVQAARRAGHALGCRALMHVGHKEYRQAAQDLTSVLRLGRLLDQGPTLIEGFVSYSLLEHFLDGVLVLVNERDVPPEILHELAEELDRLLPLPSLAEKFDIGERCVLLDFYLMIHRLGFGMLESIGGVGYTESSVREINRYRQADWDVGLRRINAVYDELTAAARETDRSRREQRLAAVRQQSLDARMKVFEKSGVMEKLSQSCQERLDVATGLTISLGTPAYQKAISAREQTETRVRQLRTALALEFYRRDRGEYPATLADLVPDYLPSLPEDTFAGSPMSYRRTDKGYLLYSHGHNGKDDGGRGCDDEPWGDDITVRMPLPPLPKREE